MERDGRPVLFPIGTVARLTGVSAMTLRNWEKRYGVPRPRRGSGSGRRLYSHDDVVQVRHLAQRVAAGTPIRKAVAADLAIRREPDRLATSLLSAVRALDPLLARQELEQAVAALDPLDAWSRVVAPVMRSLGDSWSGGEDIIAAEHLASSAVLEWLRALMAGTMSGVSPQAALACGPGELHELGTLALAALLITRGTPAVYLGANMPPTALDDVLRHMQLRVLGITATMEGPAEHVVEAVLRLAGMPSRTVLAYGGPAFHGHDEVHARLAGRAFYLGTTLVEAVACLEQLCARQ